jgi:WhiB family transcriptional regulator, redox-sensing transcriptional regulator
MSAHQTTELLPSAAQLLERAEWMASAACQGQGRLFFPPVAERPQARVKRERLAQALCDNCPVAVPCRRFARDNREYGYWGGESEAARAAAGFGAPNPIGLRGGRPAAEHRPAARRPQDPDALDAAS